MKKGTLLKTLHKPVHPLVENVVLGVGVLLVIVALILLFLQQTLLPKPTNLSKPPTPTSILAQSPNVTRTLIPTNTWKTYDNYAYHFSVMLPPEIVPVTWSDARFDPYSANGFLFSEPGNPRTWKDGFVFSIEYVPAPTGQTYPPENTFHFLNEVPLYATILGKQVKGFGWFGGKYDPEYYYTYLVPVRTNGDVLHIQFKFITERTPQEVLTKQPLIDTILSTIKVGN
jgi:hypothetical protein